MSAPLVDHDTDGTARLVTPCYLSRARLKASPEISALVRILLGGAPLSAGTDHRLIWHIFEGDPAGKRAFLFRRETAPEQTDSACFLILSPTPPPEETALFDINTQEFAPALKAGTALRFSLRANPTVAISAVGSMPRLRSRIVDVVMAAIHESERGARSELRRSAIVTAGTRWLEAQGARNGFDLIDPSETARIDGYQTHRLPRKAEEKGKPMTYSTLDFEGCLRVTDPAAFLTRLVAGFGRAKAFGCGLMLIRRA